MLQIEQIKPDAIFDMTHTARQKTWKAVEDIRAMIHPGMSEKDAIKKANAYFADLGVKKFWHRTHVRFGASTVLSFEDPYYDHVVLKENDIFYLDLGPVWDNIEGDCGDTFVVGSNAEHLQIKVDVRSVFERVKLYWRNERPTGKELYRFAESEVLRLGYLLHPSYVKGHRLSEFSHHNYTKMPTGELDFPPSPERWVLEFQICDKDLRFGAFYEDLLD